MFFDNEQFFNTMQDPMTQLVIVSMVIFFSYHWGAGVAERETIIMVEKTAVYCYEDYHPHLPSDDFDSFNFEFCLIENAPVYSANGYTSHLDY